MYRLRTSYSDFLINRKLIRKKEVVIQDSINEINELIMAGVINNENIQEILEICVCIKRDTKNVFSTFFIKNIVQLNKNDSRFLKRVFPKSIQLVLTYFYISFESHKIKLKASDPIISIELLDVNVFQTWLIQNLNISKEIYDSIIDINYINEIFNELKKKFSPNNIANLEKQYNYHIKHKNTLSIGLLWNPEKIGLTTPKVKDIIQNRFFHTPHLIMQFLKTVDVSRLTREIEIIRALLENRQLHSRNSNSIHTNLFLKFIFEHSHDMLSEINKIKEYCYQQVDQCDGVIIPGGNDIEDYVYSSIKKKCEPYEDFRRTLADLFLINRCVTKGIPLLGICRGCQIINVYFGGTIESVDNEHSLVSTKDFTIVGQESTRYKIFHENSIHSSVSLHRQCIDELGDRLKITSISGNNTAVVKSIETKMGSLVIGVQFHPEFYAEMYKFSPLNLAKQEELLLTNKRIFDLFMKSCRAYRNKKNTLEELNYHFKLSGRGENS